MSGLLKESIATKNGEIQHSHGCSDVRTYLFIGAGLLLVAASWMLGKLFSETYPTAMRWSTVLFIICWAVLAAINMVAGVTRAGYSVTEELPILLLIFSLPTLVLLVIRWQFS